MSNRYILTYILIFSALLLFSGCAVKKMVKQAEQYEAAGMFKEASDMYYQALQKKPDKAELKIDLRRTGQLYYEELASKTKNSFSRGEYKETVYYYLEAEDLMNKVERTGVSLSPDPAMDRYFADAKDQYLEDRYNVGLRHITDQDYESAKKVFVEIFDIDPNYKETRKFLNEATFEPIYREGSQLFSEGRFMDAWYKWDRIYSEVKNYKDVKDRMDQALNERYKEGTVFLMNEDFKNAADALGDVYNVNPTFRDVKVQYTEARNEPIYRQGKENLERGKCRTAYYDFDHVLSDAGSYKDTKSLKEKALACAEYPVAIYSRPVKHYTSDAVLFENTAVKKLVNKNNLFLRVFDLTAINSRAEARLLNSYGEIDENTLRSLHRDNDIKAVLILEYEDYRKNKGDLQKEKKSGFERQVMKNTEGETSIYDKPVVYYEYARENEISLTLRYKLISTESGEILLSDSYSGTESDEVRYATYSGDKNKLYPAKSIRGTNSVDESGFRRLQSLLDDRTEIKSIESLQRELYDDLAGDIASDIDKFNPER